MDTHGYPSLRINTHFTLTKVIVYNPKINVLDIGYTSLRRLSPISLFSLFPSLRGADYFDSPFEGIVFVRHRAAEIVFDVLRKDIHFHFLCISE